jgi:hypothetical protein
MVETVSKRGILAVVALLALASACSSSNSEVKPDGAAGTTGGGGITGTGGTGAVDSGVCQPRTTYAEASHLIVNVTWDPGLAAMGGTGQVHIWGKIVFTVSGNSLSGTLQACGIALPPATLNALAGGGMLQIQVPDAAWDAPSMPRFQVDGTMSGWGVGSTLNYSYAALVGFTMDNPTTAAWPSSYTGITMTNDAEGDMNPGLTSIPRSDGTFKLPPTSIAQTSRADELYIVTRQVTSATLTRPSCDQASGTAMLAHFDNHVVGCHIMGGSDCMPTEVSFIDTNRTLYEITSATAETKTVAETATCADVRAALPM